MLVVLVFADVSCTCLKMPGKLKHFEFIPCKLKVSNEKTELKHFTLLPPEHLYSLLLLYYYSVINNVKL